MNNIWLKHHAFCMCATGCVARRLRLPWCGHGCRWRMSWRWVRRLARWNVAFCSLVRPHRSVRPHHECRHHGPNTGRPERLLLLQGWLCALPCGIRPWWKLHRRRNRNWNDQASERGLCRGSIRLPLHMHVCQCPFLARVSRRIVAQHSTQFTPLTPSWHHTRRMPRRRKSFPGLSKMLEILYQRTHATAEPNGILLRSSRVLLGTESRSSV
jgi:hypothetical protein